MAQATEEMDHNGVIVHYSGLDQSHRLEDIE